VHARLYFCVVYVGGVGHGRRAVSLKDEFPAFFSVYIFLLVWLLVAVVVFIQKSITDQACVVRRLAGLLSGRSLSKQRHEEMDEERRGFKNKYEKMTKNFACLIGRARASKRVPPRCTLFSSRFSYWF